VATEERGLRPRLEADLKDAMRASDQTAKDTIRYLLAAVKNAEIDRGGPLTEQEGLAVLQKQAKQRQDSIDQFRSGGRADLVEREEAQLAVLRRYLPAPLSDNEVDELARRIIDEVGATSLKDLAKVMPILVQRAAGRADGRRLNEAARRLLSV
jgi:uncharacterized protein YqeY